MGINYQPISQMQWGQQTGYLAWNPTLTGKSNDPVPTYSQRLGEYQLIGDLCVFRYSLITTTMTKSTLTDEIRITLPFYVSVDSSNISRTNAFVGNATPVKNGNSGRIIPNTQYVEMRHIPPTTAEQALTYGLTDLGVLTNTITFEGSGIYRINT